MDDNKLLADVLRRFFNKPEGSGYVWLDRRHRPDLTIDALVELTEEEAEALARYVQEDGLVENRQ